MRDAFSGTMAALHALWSCDAVTARLSKYLTVADLVTAGACCKTLHQDVRVSGALTKSLRFHGVQPKFRFAFWAHLAGVSELRRTSSFGSLDFSAGEVQRYAMEGSGHPTGVVGEIYRDIGRTFPLHPLFAEHGAGQVVLMGILKAFARHHPDIGYCQGMNYVAAALIVLYNTPHPGEPPLTGLREDTAEVVFWLLTALSRRYACDQLWRPGVPRLRLIGYQLDRLLKSLLPRLWRHFQDVGLSFEVLAAQWLLPLMSITLPFPTLARIWELFFAEGWKLLFRVAVALFAALEPRFLELDVSDMTKFFRKWKQLCAEQHSLAHDASMLPGAGTMAFPPTPPRNGDAAGVRAGAGAGAGAGAAGPTGVAAPPGLPARSKSRGVVRGQVDEVGLPRLRRAVSAPVVPPTPPRRRRRGSWSVRGSDDGFWVIADPHGLVDLALRKKVTTKMLMELEMEYAMAALKARVTPSPGDGPMSLLPVLPPTLDVGGTATTFTRRQSLARFDGAQPSRGARALARRGRPAEQLKVSIGAPKPASVANVANALAASGALSPPLMPTPGSPESDERPRVAVPFNVHPLHASRASMDSIQSEDAATLDVDGAQMQLPVSPQPSSEGAARRRSSSGRSFGMTASHGSIDSAVGATPGPGNTPSPQRRAGGRVLGGFRPDEHQARVAVRGAPVDAAGGGGGEEETVVEWHDVGNLDDCDDLKTPSPRPAAVGATAVVATRVGAAPVAAVTAMPAQNAVVPPSGAGKPGRARSGSSFGDKIKELREEMSVLDGPVKHDVAVLISKIEAICRRVPAARADYTASGVKAQHAAVVVEELLEHKRRLKEQLHQLMTHAPPRRAAVVPNGAVVHTAHRDRNSTNAAGGGSGGGAGSGSGSGNGIGNGSGGTGAVGDAAKSKYVVDAHGRRRLRVPFNIVPAHEWQSDPPPRGGQRGGSGGSAVRAGGDDSRPGTGTVAGGDRATGSAGGGSGADGATPPRTDPVLLKSFAHKLAMVDDKLAKASATWRQLVWAHTMAATQLEETLDSKRAMSGQLVGVLAGVEAAKERRLVQLWRGITLADLDWQNDAPSW